MTLTTPDGPTSSPPHTTPQYGWNPPSGDPARPGVSLRELTRRVVRRRWLMLGVAVVVFGAVAAWTLLSTPRYKSEARLRIATQAASSPLASAVSDPTSALPGASLLGLGRDELE